MNKASNASGKKRGARSRLLAIAAILAAAGLVLAGCTRPTAGDDDAGPEPRSDDAVFNEMTSWDGCWVLEDLQQVVDYMGIEGWGSSTGGSPEPTSQRFERNTWDPAALGCGGMIYLGSWEGYGISGELLVKIVPTESEDQALAAYEERVAAAETEAAKWTGLVTEEFTDPWDQGVLMSWTGSAENWSVQTVARDGQWVSHIRLYHSQDWGAVNDEPLLDFTPEERNRWLIDTYLPTVNQIVNDRIAVPPGTTLIHTMPLPTHT